MYFPDFIPLASSSIVISSNSPGFISTIDKNESLPKVNDGKVVAAIPPTNVFFRKLLRLSPDGSFLFLDMIRSPNYL